jgi:hypothetical protein
MTRRKGSRVPLAHWVDDHVPDLAPALAGLGVDVAEFSAWLAPRVAEWRSAQYITDNLPGPSEVAMELRALGAAARKLYEALGGLSEPARAMLATATCGEPLPGDGRNIVELRQDARRAACWMGELADLAAQRTEALHLRGGRPSHAARDELFGAIVKKLRDAGASAGQARSVAERALIACRVPVMQDEREQKRASSPSG